MNNNIFWTEQPYQILKNYNIILPTSDMSRVEQLNTITRFLIYFLVLCLIFDINSIIIIYILIGIILIIILYYIYINDPEKDETYENFNKSLKENNNDIDSCTNCHNNVDKELNKPMINIYDNHKNKIFKGNANPNKLVEIDSGYINSDNNYRLGENYSEINYNQYKKKNKKKEKKVSWDDNQKKKNSRKPTVENPFTNIVFSDYLDAQNIAEPCNIDDNDIPNEMQNLYNSSIYRNLSDVWERENSQRTFYTVPIQTVPNSQTDFANWLYKTGPTCHENTEYCTYYQDPAMTSSRY